MNFLQRCLVSAVVHSVNMHVIVWVGTHVCNDDASIVTSTRSQNGLHGQQMVSPRKLTAVRDCLNNRDPGWDRDLLTYECVRVIPRMTLRLRWPNDVACQEQSYRLQY